MHLATAATTTKKTAIAAKDATIKGVEHLKAAPQTVRPSYFCLNFFLLCALNLAFKCFFPVQLLDL